jgi:hypothetical protein
MRPSHWFNLSGCASTARPFRSTGIPSFAHPCAVDVRLSQELRDTFPPLQNYGLGFALRPSFFHCTILIVPVAYKIPTSQEMQDEIDNLDLTLMRQNEVQCPGCNVRYVLIYDPIEVEGQVLQGYRRAIEIGMHGCNQHPPKIILNF